MQRVLLTSVKYKPIRHNIMTTCLILCWSSYYGPECSEPLGMDQRSSQGVLWGLDQDVGSGSFGYSGLCSGASVNPTCSTASCWCLIRMGSRKFGGQINMLGHCHVPQHVPDWLMLLPCGGVHFPPVTFGISISMRECVCSGTMFIWVSKSHQHGC